MNIDTTGPAGEGTDAFEPSTHGIHTAASNDSDPSAVPGPALEDELVRQAERLVEAGRNTVRLSSEVLKQHAADLSTTTSDRIKAEPLKSVLIAAAAGALFGMFLTRTRRDVY